MDGGVQSQRRSLSFRCLFRKIEALICNKWMALFNDVAISGSILTFASRQDSIDGVTRRTVNVLIHKRMPSLNLVIIQVLQHTILWL